MSIRDRVQSGTGDEGWTIHADGSLQYRGRVVSRPDSRSDSDGGSESGLGRETIYWDSLPVIFFKAELVPVGTQTISVITKIIYIYKRTTTGVVSIKTIHIY